MGEAPGSQGAPTQAYTWYAKEKQRSEPGCLARQPTKAYIEYAEEEQRSEAGSLRRQPAWASPPST